MTRLFAIEARIGAGTYGVQLVGAPHRGMGRKYVAQLLDRTAGPAAPAVNDLWADKGNPLPAHRLRKDQTAVTPVAWGPLAPCPTSN